MLRSGIYTFFVLLVLFSSKAYAGEALSFTWYLQLKENTLPPKSLQVKLKQSGLKLKGYYFNEKYQIQYLKGQLIKTDSDQWDFYLEEAARPVEWIGHLKKVKTKYFVTGQLSNSKRRYIKPFADFKGTSELVTPHQVIWQMAQPLSIRDKFGQLGGYWVHYKLVSPQHIQCSLKKQVQEDEFKELTFKDIRQSDLCPTGFIQSGQYTYQMYVQQVLVFSGRFFYENETQKLKNVKTTFHLLH